MTKPLKRKPAQQWMVKSPKNDPMIEEFLTRDLGEDIAASGVSMRVRAQQPTSIVLSAHLIEKLRAKGAKRGLGYQTMLKMIVMEHIDKY